MGCRPVHSAKAFGVTTCFASYIHVMNEGRCVRSISNRAASSNVYERADGRRAHLERAEGREARRAEICSPPSKAKFPPPLPLLSDLRPHLSVRPNSLPCPPAIRQVTDSLVFSHYPLLLPLARLCSASANFSLDLTSLSFLPRPPSRLRPSVPPDSKW